MGRVFRLRKCIKICIIFLCVVLVAMMLRDVIINVAIPSMCSHDPWRSHIPGGTILDCSNLAYVKFEKKKRNAFSEERTVCTFEVIEWLNGGNGETRIQAYSGPYQDDCVKSRLEFYAEHYGMTYEKGKTYIIDLVKDANGKYLMMANIYIPLYNLRRSNCMSKLTFRDGTVKGEDLAPADLLFYLREHYANEENGGETGEETAITE